MESPYSMGGILSQDSHNSDQEEEVKHNTIETDDTDTLERLKENPLAPLLDESKLDKVFILPLFCKPGTH